ncbi:MAG: hypothetical protein KDA42_06555 [Planctomycetales bacterium]|nr:hypothetical protein [Planctomycetales bacterium]
MIVPVEGRVLYNGEPLTNGSIMFQPASGQPAVGGIQPDGSFRMSTFKPNDGATVGLNKVRVASFEGKQIAAEEGEASMGTLAIPQRYTSTAKSGIEVEVLPDSNEPFIIELTDSESRQE